MNPILFKLQAISGLIAQRSEVLVIFVVIGVVFMMILPLPTGLVDSLIALNISVSSLMVVIAMYMPSPLAFSTFPALLLITTLFRMALSITTTRLILLEGDAGNIVEAFGNFVVGGNLVVGLVIFLILTIVNFLVITKGSERVAEVSARFTLDAMPGKQMSIDSDLRAGLIDAETAQKKRANVGRESQLFGAMDGAMKFVKGDAIAGIIIVLVNILGGFSIGVLQLGLPAGEAIKLYAILTIGDGLVAQIPALLISLTAGLIITRVTDTSADIKNVGQEMASELSSEPKAWIIAAIVMLGFALVPGMPFFAFMAFASIFGSCGAYQIWVGIKKARAYHGSDVEREEEEFRNRVEEGETDLKVFLPYQKLSFIIHPHVKYAPECINVLKAIRRARNKIVTDKGYTLPSIEIEEDDTFEEGIYQIKIYGVPCLIGSLYDNKLVVNEEDMTDALLESLGDNCEKGQENRTESDIFWVNDDQLSLLDEQSIPYKTSIDFIYKRADSIFRKESYQFIGVEEVNKLMGWVTNEFPALAQEIQRVLPVPKLGEVLQKLSLEDISIRSVRKILETLSDKAATERDIDVLADSVRIAIRDQICNELATNNTLNICLLESETEEALRGSIRQTANGTFLALSQEDNESLTKTIIEQEKSRSGEKTILVVAQDLRRPVRELIKSDLFHIPVLSYSELTPSVSVVPVARLSI